MRPYVDSLDESLLRSSINSILSDSSFSRSVKAKIRKILQTAYTESGACEDVFYISKDEYLTPGQVKLISDDWIDIAPNLIELACAGMHVRESLGETLLKLDDVLDGLSFSHLKASYASSRGRSVITGILLCAGLKYISARDLTTGKNGRRLRPIKGYEMNSVDERVCMAVNALKQVVSNKNRTAIESII